MPAPTSIVPCRGDFFATDTGTSVLKIAIQNRDFARGESARSNRWVAQALRTEMRYYARIAVNIARRCRASRT